MYLKFTKHKNENKHFSNFELSDELPIINFGKIQIWFKLEASCFFIFTDIMIFIFWQIDGSFQCLHVNPMLQRKHVMLPLIVREVFWLDRRLSTRSRSAPNGVTTFKIVVTFYGAQMFHSALDSPKSVLKYPAQPLSIFMIWTHANILMPRTNWRMTVIFRMPRKFFYYF